METIDAIFEAIDYIWNTVELLHTLSIVGIISSIVSIILLIVVLLSISGLKEQFNRYQLNYNKDHNRYPQ